MCIRDSNQKLVEIAPSPGLPERLRARLTAAAVQMAEAVRYDNLGTFEFLVEAALRADLRHGDAEFAFIEANPRLQVEHTVTEEVTGIDLVKLQLQLAGGSTLTELGVRQADIPKPRGFAIQMRINMESMGTDGTAKPSGGTLTAFEAPSGPGLRVDSFAYAGYTTNPNFDSLLAKLIAHSPSADFSAAVTRAYRALCEFRIEGVATNIGFLQSLLRHPDFAANRLYTRFVEEHIAELVADANSSHRQLFFAEAADAAQPRRAGARRASGARHLAGAKIDAIDPLAVLSHGKSGANSAAAMPVMAASAGASAHEITGPENTVALAAPMQGTIVSIDVREGELVHKGQQLFVMEAMKMEHVIRAHTSGIVRQIAVAERDAIFEGHPLAFIEEAEVEIAEAAEAEKADLDRIRPDLAEVYERHAKGLDAARPEAVARRRRTVSYTHLTLPTICSV